MTSFNFEVVTNDFRSVVLTCTLIGLMALPALGLVHLIFDIWTGGLNWLSIALTASPVAIIVGFLALVLVLGTIYRVRRRMIEREPHEVASILMRAAEGKPQTSEWSAFRRRPISDPGLDRIRMRAIVSGPPKADRLMMKQLAKEAQQLAE